MNKELYFSEEFQRVSKLFSKSKHKGFKDKTDLARWFVEELVNNECSCYYCNTSIFDINKLIDIGILKERKTGYGMRGRNLEIDKNDDSYTKGKCVLACYYCNNDKSYIYEKEVYKEFFGINRGKFHQFNLSQNNV